MKFTVNAIGVIHSPYKEKSNVPHQGKFSQELCQIEIFSEYEAGLKDIETCSHLILIYWLDRAKRDVLLALTPHDDLEHGVLATRSPNRPNPLGFCVVKLEARRGRFLEVRGVDALEGTPLIDIKPYSSELDSIPEARVGWFEEAKKRRGK